MTGPNSSLNVNAGTTNRSIEAIPSARFRRNVHQVCPVGRPPFAMYFDTVDCATLMPSFKSSPWIRSAPQNGFTRLISRIGLRTSASIFGRPGVPRGFHR
jgi:hypothetical protein